MMRNNGLLKWTLHKNKNGSSGKNWQHAPEALTSGHIAYLVKFLGVTEAEHPKGIDVVKDCIRKLKLDEEIRRAEGLKTPKAEVTISVDGVAVQEPKGKKILHQFPLHQISYCADDKAEKKYFTFIAKEGDTHKCFVFASEKLAEEITLTIGQAFDLAYKRFLESSGRELDLKREIQALQKRVAELESENTDLKQKLFLSPETNSNASTSSMSDTLDLLMSPSVPPRSPTNVANQLIAELAVTATEIEKRANAGRNGDSNGFLLEDLESEENFTTIQQPPPPPRLCPPPAKGKKAEVGINNGTNDLNGLTLNGGGTTNGNLNGIGTHGGNLNGNHALGNGLSALNGLNISSPANGHHPKENGLTGSPGNSDIFGSDPFFTSPDPFGMTNFNSSDNSGGSSPKAPIVTSSITSSDFQSPFTTTPTISSSLNNGGSNLAMMNATVFNSNTTSSNGFTNTGSSIFNNVDNSTGSLFNTATANMNMLNQFSFQQQQEPVVKKPANLDSALRILDKNIEEMKIGFSQKS